MRAINAFQDEATSLCDAVSDVVSAADNMSQTVTVLRDRVFQERRELANAIAADDKHSLLSDASRSLVVEMHDCLDRAYEALDRLYTTIHHIVE